MADSFFIPQSLLSTVPEEQQKDAASQASKSFWMGLLGGSPAQAYQNAQATGYNALSHYNALQENARKQQVQGLLSGATQDAMMQGPGALTADPAYAPRAADGTEMAGPGYKPGPVTFNTNQYYNDPRVRAALALTDPNKFAEFADPKLMTNNGFVFSGRDASNIGKYMPKLENGALPVYDAQGNVVGQKNAAGTLQVLGSQAGAVKGAEARANANYQFQNVVLPNDTMINGKLVPAGTTVQVTNAQASDAARNGTPLVSSLAPTVQATMKGYEPILTDAYDKYKLANDRKPNLERLIELSGQIDTNSFTPAKAQIQGYLNAMGITGDQTKRFLTDVSGFRSAVNNLAAENIRVLTGPKSNFDIAFTKERQGQLTDPAAANQFNFELTAALDRRNKAYYDFVQSNPSADVLKKWENSDMGKASVYEDPALRKFLPSQTVVSGPQQGKTAYKLPGGEWKVFD